MLRRPRKLLGRDQRGITGLETAIILIAFVVVAAVFAYTALSAGLFSTQESQRAVYSGLETTQSTLELRGGVIGLTNTTGHEGHIRELTFTLALVAGGQPIDFRNPTGADGLATSTDHRVVISYIDKDQRVDDLLWSSTPLGNANDNDILEPGEKFQITVDLAAVDSPNLGCDRAFAIEVKPPQGAVLSISRTAPPYIHTVNNLN